MAWDKNLIAEGVLAPDLNDEIRANWAALETALNKEMYFSTGGTASLQGILKQGNARMFSQASAPATRVDGSAFASTDLGMSWIDTGNNKIYTLTATTPTWTLISTEIIAVLLASARTFAATVTFAKAPTLTEGIVANNSYLQARNQADDGNVNMIKINASNVPTVPDGTANVTSAAPTADAQLANKKYADDLTAAIFGALSGGNDSAGKYIIGNFRLEWGKETGVSGDSTVVTFTGGFFTKVFKLIPVMSTDSGGNTRNPSVTSLDNVNATVRHDNEENTGFDWVAIGR